MRKVGEVEPLHGAALPDQIALAEPVSKKRSRTPRNQALGAGAGFAMLSNAACNACSPRTKIYENPGSSCHHRHVHVSTNFELGTWE